jgi:hypothetical protein
MAKSRSSSSKRQREFQKRERERRKAEKAAEKRQRRENPTLDVGLQFANGETGAPSVVEAVDSRADEIAQN